MEIAPTTAQVTTDPAKPSHDFLGLSDGAMEWRAEPDADGIPADVREDRDEDEDDDPLTAVGPPA